MKPKVPADSLVTDNRHDNDHERSHVVYIEGPEGLVEVWAEQPRDFTISINGQRFEHVSTTPAGQWVYRAS